MQVNIRSFTHSLSHSQVFNPVYKMRYLMTELSNGICSQSDMMISVLNALMKLVSVSQSGFIYCFQQEIKAVVAVVPVIKHTNV